MPRRLNHLTLLYQRQHPNQADIDKAVNAVKTNYERFNKGENSASDRNILGIVLKMYNKDIDPAQQPAAFYSMLKSGYGDLELEQTYQKYAKDVFDNTFILNKDKWTAFIAKPDTGVYHKDIAYKTAMAFANNFNSNYGKYYTEFIANSFIYNNKYLKGVLENEKRNSHVSRCQFHHACFVW